MLTILFLSFLITILQLFSSEDSLVLANHKHTFIATFILFWCAYGFTLYGVFFAVLFTIIRIALETLRISIYYFQSNDDTNTRLKFYTIFQSLQMFAPCLVTLI